MLSLVSLMQLLDLWVLDPGFILDCHRTCVESMQNHREEVKDVQQLATADRAVTTLEDRSN